MARAITVLTTVGSLTVLCWLSMQVLHEAGHVIAAQLTGGQVNRVILHPLVVSRTDVDPNPAPGTVAWMGPEAGCLLPALATLLVRSGRQFANRDSSEHGTADTLTVLHLRFFTGFCLIANGACLVFGTPGRIGDCGELLRAGTPVWQLFTGGSMALAAGLVCWHRPGSPTTFLRSSQQTGGEAIALLAGVLMLIALELWCSS